MLQKYTGNVYSRLRETDGVKKRAGEGKKGVGGGEEGREKVNDPKNMECLAIKRFEESVFYKNDLIKFSRFVLIRTIA